MTDTQLLMMGIRKGILAALSEASMMIVMNGGVTVNVSLIAHGISSVPVLMTVEIPELAENQPIDPELADVLEYS